MDPLLVKYYQEVTTIYGFSEMPDPVTLAPRQLEILTNIAKALHLRDDSIAKLAEQLDQARNKPRHWWRGSDSSGW